MGVVVALCWFFPLFRIVPLESAAKVKADALFNPAQFAEKFWSGPLTRVLDQATPLHVLLPMIERDPAEARKKYARSLGLSDSYTYFIAGQGRVVALSNDEISLAVGAGKTNAEVSLQMGLLFNNAVRDGTGLLAVSDFPNSQDFNNISEALNHIIETRVQPKLREEAKVGSLVRFVGCVEVNDEPDDLKPLRVVPIKAEIQ